MPARRKKIGMDHYLSCASCNKLGKALIDRWMFDFQKCCYDKIESTAEAYLSRSFLHVFIRFPPPASVADNKHSSFGSEIH
jgi:hypothetical protein